MILKGKFVTLRPIEEEDIEFIRNMINDPWFESMIVGWSFAISKKEQKAWFDSFKNSSNQLRFIIQTEADGVVGFTGLKNIDWKNGTADGGGMRIAKRENMSRGIATDAYMTLLKYAFYELRLNRINGSVLGYNPASIKATSKVGFKQEGIMRQCVYKNGVYHDVILLGVLKSDYEQVVTDTDYWNK